MANLYINRAEISQADREACDRSVAYVQQILAVFPDGEDTAAVLAALSSAVSLVISDVGVTVETFAESLRQNRARIARRPRG